MLQKGFGFLPIIFIGGLTVFLGVGFYFVYSAQNRSTVVQATPVPLATPTKEPVVLSTPNPSATPIVQKIALPVATLSTEPLGNGFTQYRFNIFQFKAPSDWVVKAVISDYIEGPEIIVSDPQKKASVQITYPGDYPYGFGPEGPKPGNEVVLKINGEEISVKEYIGQTGGFVDLLTGKERFVHILFGVGYPVHTEVDGNLEDYTRYKNTMIEIVESLTF